MTDRGLGPIFDFLQNTYPKYYAPSEHLAADEITILLKARIILKHDITKEHMRFGIINKYIYHVTYLTTQCNMDVYSGEDRASSAADMTARHAPLKHVTKKVE
jgi:hypothetical protein